MDKLKNIQGSYITPKVAVVFSSFLLRVLELSGSNFGPGSNNSNWKISWFSLVFLGKYPYSNYG
jgi:hypothetical protein